MNDSDDITADKADPVESNDPDGKLCPIEQHDLRADMAEAPTAAERAQDLARALNQRVPCCILLEQESLIAAAIRDAECKEAVRALDWAAYYYDAKPRYMDQAQKLYADERQ